MSSFMIPFIAASVLMASGCQSNTTTHEEKALDSPKRSSQGIKTLNRAQELKAGQKMDDAGNLYLKLAQDYSGTDIAWQAIDEWAPYALTTYFKTLNDENSREYIVKPGDNLTRIAKAFGVTAGSIQAANQLKSSRIYPNMRLRVMSEEWRLEVEKSQNIMHLFAGDVKVRTYRVATGENNSTPIGEFKIINRLTDPTWYYEGEVEPAGSPDNPLGTRWLGFDLDGYGLHGTTNPEQIGQHATLGCIRMHNNEIEELFELLPVGAMVVIKE